MKFIMNVITSEIDPFQFIFINSSTRRYSCAKSDHVLNPGGYVPEHISIGRTAVTETMSYWKLGVRGAASIVNTQQILYLH
jgi:hypothetical protein